VYANRVSAEIIYYFTIDTGIGAIIPARYKLHNCSYPYFFPFRITSTKLRIHPTHSNTSLSLGLHWGIYPILAAPVLEDSLSRLNSLWVCYPFWPIQHRDFEPLQNAVADIFTATKLLPTLNKIRCNQSVPRLVSFAPNKLQAFDSHYVPPLQYQ